MVAKKLSEIVKLNSNFKNAINLYLNLNKIDKVESYIPTKSSLKILKRYIDSVEQNKNQSTILVGSYGKGKSHLLLILLAIVSMNRNDANNKIVEELFDRVKAVDEEAYEVSDRVWKAKGRFLPVIISGSQDDLNQAFMVALNDSLKREELSDLMPDTFYSTAIQTIDRWKRDYPDTYKKYFELLQGMNHSVGEIEAGLKLCNPKKLNVFKSVYPKLTAGSVFNPLAGGDVLPMYKSVADKLKEEYGYSGIYIVFDEFSKFIEGQDKHVAGSNMKLLQDLCELANESKDTSIFITMVAHKSIKEYGNYLSDATINAFTGIEGRIEEVLFNTSSKNNYELIQNAIKTDTDKLSSVPQANKYFGKKTVEDYYKIAAFRSAFTIEDFERIIVKGCYPLSPVSAYALLNISEKVAQNERTLFTFVSKEEPFSIAKYVVEHPSAGTKDWIITPDRVYDYFKNAFKKEISNEYIHTEWLNAEYAISKAQELNKVRLLKVLAILNIINKYDEMPPAEEILVAASGIPNAKDMLDALENEKLIYKKGSNNCYAFKTRAGSELKNEIKNRRALKDGVDISKVFSQISDIQYVLPKRYNNDYSMTRYFRYEYMCVSDFLKIEDATVFFEDGRFQDGKVIALYSLDESDSSKAVKAKVENFRIENLIVIYSRTYFGLEKQAKDYEIIQDIKADAEFMRENEVLTKELLIMEEDLEKEISRFIEDEFGNESSNMTVYYNGRGWKKSREISVSKVVDQVCENYYSATVVINNEMINKQVITTAPIKKARKIIMESILKKESDEFYMRGTSAESTIYRAVLVNSGILSNKKTVKVQNLLNIFTDFFDECIEKRKTLGALVAQYGGKPYGMRAGVLPIILAYFISQKNEDFVIYFENREVELNVDNILSMVDFPDKYSVFISKESAEKEVYIKELTKLFDVENEINLSGNRITNVLTCMQRWYRALPQNAKNIKKENEYVNKEVVLYSLPKMKNLMQKVDVNAYEAIFETIPEICSGSSDYKETIEVLKEVKLKLNGYMDWVLDKAVSETILVFDRKAKEDLSHTLKNWYEKQSDLAKDGLHNSSITGLMSCIADINTYDEKEIVQKIIKIVSEIYIDSWNDDSFDEYITKLETIKGEVEAIVNQSLEGKYELSFTGKNGEVLHKYYEKVDESTGAIFRNILEDTLEDFSDLSVNSKVAILLEAIEKVMRKED